MKFSLYLIISISAIFLISCAPKTETVYVDRYITIMPDMPTAFTDVVQPAKNPAKDPNAMTQRDILQWWTLLRNNLQEANQKLIKIRVWYNQQSELLNSEKNKTLTPNPTD